MGDQSKATLLVIASLSLLGVLVTVASILILTGGKVYHRIPEKSRPRRWFVAIFFSYFVVFCVWFPVWFFYPRSIIALLLSLIFGAFTAFIGAWYALGKVAFILLPIIALVERTVDAFRDTSKARRR
jgi:quinol-cytochrome oxidoreductase complex cytochrome b subunit